MLGTPSPFIRRLDEWRTQLGMDHRQFAAYLGIDESYWSMLRHGKRRGGMQAEKLIERVRAERPELVYLLLSTPATPAA